MVQSTAWAVAGEKRTDWERMIQYYGFCEVIPDRTKPQQVERAFREWALKRRLACVEGENLVAFDPKAFNPKDSLDRARFAFLARYFRPRESAAFLRDVETAFNVHSMHVVDAVQRYWMTEGIIQDAGGQFQVNRDLLRLMGFSYMEIMQALDGVVKKDFLKDIPNGHRLIDPVFGVEYGHYVVNFDIMKERFFDSEFMLQVAGQPIALTELGSQMGVDDMDDLRRIMRDAKKRYDLNIEVSDDHVMFGAPSPSSVEHLIGKEKTHKEQLAQAENQLKDRQRTIKEMLERYTTHEAKMMNQIESLKEEGRLVWIKGKIVAAVKQHLGQSGKGVA